MIEAIGLLALWMIGSVITFYAGFLGVLYLAFGLEGIPDALIAGGSCLLIWSLIYWGAVL